MGNLLAVVVIFNVKLKESVTLKALINIFNNNKIKLNLLIYDNSLIPQNTEELANIFNLFYYHNPNNPGICEAYNYSLKVACNLKVNWILIIDQDTLIKEDYFKEINDNKLLYGRNEHVCIAPIVRSLNSNNIQTPKKLIWNILDRKIDEIHFGISKFKITSMNSGLILSVEFLKSINGFNIKYKLDGLDHWLFRTISRKNKKVYILKTAVYHNLSIESYESNVSIKRHKSILESINISSRENPLFFIIQKLRLIKMFLKELKFKNKRYSILTLKYIFK